MSLLIGQTGIGRLNVSTASYIWVAQCCHCAI